MYSPVPSVNYLVKGAVVGYSLRIADLKFFVKPPTLIVAAAIMCLTEMKRHLFIVTSNEASESPDRFASESGTDARAAPSPFRRYHAAQNDHSPVKVAFSLSLSLERPNRFHVRTLPNVLSVDKSRAIAELEIDAKKDRECLCWLGRGQRPI